MRNLATADAARVRAISSELDTLACADESGLGAALPAARELLDLEAMVVYSISPAVDGLRLTRFEGDKLHPQLRPLLTRMIESTPEPLFYDAVRPAVDQRNQAIEATAWIDRAGPGTWEASAFCQQVLAPAGFAQHKQLRALVCDGPALLGWFGGITLARPTPRQHALLQALVPAVRRRLLLERRLGAQPRALGALVAALDRLGSAAFVIGAQGEIHEMNEAGRGLLAERRAAITGALRDAIAGRAPALDVELVPVRDSGVPACWLAMIRVDDPAAARIAAAAARAHLTPRQRAVLELVAKGLTNATIAAVLEIGERAVELHVTALFARFACDNRAALVARVLT